MKHFVIIGCLMRLWGLSALVEGTSSRQVPIEYLTLSLGEPPCGCLVEFPPRKSEVVKDERRET